MDSLERKQRLNELSAAFGECQQALSAIGDSTRQSIIMALIEGGGDECGIRVGELAARTNLSRPAVSHHMKVLKDANLIGMKRRGTRNYYYLEVFQSDIFKLKRLIDDAAMFVQDLQADAASGICGNQEDEDQEERVT